MHANEVEMPKDAVQRVRLVKSLIEVFGLKGKRKLYVGEAV